MVEPTGEDQHSSGKGSYRTFVQHIRGRLVPGMYLAGLMMFWVRGSVNSIRPEFLECLDVVNAAPDAAGMDMGPLQAARGIDDRPHGTDSQSIGPVIFELAAHHVRGRVDVLNQSCKRGVLVQLDVAVPTPQLREVRLAHPGSVAFSFGVDRLDQVGIQKLAARNFQRKNERRKIAFHFERVFGRTSHQAAVRRCTVRSFARHFIFPLSVTAPCRQTPRFVTDHGWSTLNLDVSSPLRSIYYTNAPTGRTGLMTCIPWVRHLDYAPVLAQSVSCA